MGALAAPALAAAPAHTRIECEIDARARTVAGQVELRLENRAAAPLDRVYLWLMPNRLARKSAGVNDVNYYWVYPHRFNPGSMRIRGISVGQGDAARALPGQSWRPEPHAVAGRDALWSVALPAPLPSGAEVTLTIRYDGVIPERYGTYGCVDETCTLVGGFYPMLAAHDERGWDLAGPPMRGDIEVVVDLPRQGSVVVFDRWSGDRVFRAEGRATDVPYATVFVAPKWYETTRVVGQVELRHLATAPPPPADDARGKILPYTQENYTRYALDTAEKALELLGGMGVPLPPGHQLTLIEAPLRQDLAMAQPEVVLMSDRWYRIWPARRFRKFHDRELVRAVAAARFMDRIRRAGRERPRDINVAADILGAYAADVFTLQEHKKQEFAGEILQPVSFVPVVDQLLYAPQTMFASSYFGDVLDDEATRDRPERFNHQRPRGRLYYEKLRDLLSTTAMAELMKAMLEDQQRYEVAAEAAYGGSLDWFFRQWRLPYPRVNYKLAGKRTIQLGPGRFRHEITVAKEVAPGDHAPVEPVEVLVVLRNGARHRLRWDGAGDRTTLVVEATARIDRVRVDPKGRLIEADLDGGDQTALFDNVDDHDVRFVYNSFGVLLNVTDLSALLAIDFTLSRVHDTKNEVRFTAWRSSSVTAGAWVEYRRAFGPALDPDTLMSRVALSAALRRLDPTFFSSDELNRRGATSFTLGFEARSDDRIFYFEPLFARALVYGLDATVTRRDTLPLLADDDLLLSGVTSVRYTNVWTPRPNHTLGVNATAHVAFGDIRDRTQLIDAGGISGLRGYAEGELFTRARLMLRGEYRHWFRHDLAWNFGHYNHVRGVGGALFVDVAAMAPCGDYELTDPDGLYASAGYGLRFPYDSFGTLPFLMRVDLAVPLVKRSRSCLGETQSDGPPVMLYVSFEPPF